MTIDRQTGIIITRLLVNRAADRVTFDLELPRDVHRVTGIGFHATQAAGVVTAFGAGLPPVEQAGQVSLRWFAPGDIFYQAQVDFGFSYESSYAPMGIALKDLFSDTGFPVHGLKHVPVSINVEGRQRRIRGFYKDTVNEIAGTHDPYAVFCYLYYEKVR